MAKYNVMIVMAKASTVNLTLDSLVIPPHVLSATTFLCAAFKLPECFLGALVKS